MSYKFESDAQEFDIIFEISNIIKGYFPHIGITAREGISVLYRRSGSKNWLNIDSFFSKSTNTGTKNEHNQDLFYSKSKKTIDMSCYVDEGEKYEILIYAPIISQLTKLNISFSEDVYVKKLDEISNKTMVVVGGPISYGIGCTNVKSMFSNILERKYDATVSHVTFNEKDYINSVLKYYDEESPLIADVGIIEIDYFLQKESVVENLLPDLITVMKQRCKHLIGWYAISDRKSFKKIIANNTIKEFVYNKDIKLVDLSYIFDKENKDICVYNKYYVSDSGNFLIYKKLDETLRGLVKWNF